MVNEREYTNTGLSMWEQIRLYTRFISLPVAFPGNSAGRKCDLYYSECKSTSYFGCMYALAYMHKYFRIAQRSMRHFSKSEPR